MSEPDAMDQPEGDGYELVVPFIACQSQGGPYDDDSFVAGFQAGRIDQTLGVAAVIGAMELRVTVNSELVKQLDLIAMNHGFRSAVESEDGPWTFMTFRAEE